MLMPTKHPAAPQVAGTPSPKLESIGRPRRPPPLYILMSSISSHWTIQPPLTLCTFISDPIWPPQEVQCIMKTVKLNLEHCIFNTHSSLGASCETRTRPAGLCLYSCPLSLVLSPAQLADKCFVVLSRVLLRCLVNTQINVFRELHMKAERSIKPKQQGLA